MSGDVARKLSQDEVATLRHDLRTPVNHIVGYCELLLEDADGDAHADRRARLQGSLRAVREALDMINSSLAPGGRDVAQSDVDALYERLRGPHARITELMSGILEPPEARNDAGFTEDVGRIRHATEQLVAVHRPSAAAHAEPVQSSVNRNANAGPAARGSILIVDDEVNNRSVLERHLERQGYDVT